MRMMDNDGCYMDATAVNLAGTVWRLGWMVDCRCLCGVRLIAASGACVWVPIKSNRWSD